MGRVWRILSFVIVLAVLCGGCPIPMTGGLGSEGEASSTGSGGSGSSAGSSGGSSGSAGSATSDTQDLDDRLAEQFPGCFEVISADEWRAEILRLVNIERQRAGVSTLRHDQELEDLATQYACEMIHYDFFAHDNPVTGTELRDRAEEFGIRILTDNDNYFAIGENLAAGQSTPARAMSDWMASEHHRDNILDPTFTELGVGVRTGGTYHTYWVQEFGRPLHD